MRRKWEFCTKVWSCQIWYMELLYGVVVQRPICKSLTRFKGEQFVWALFLIASLLGNILGHTTNNWWWKSKIKGHIRSEESSEKHQTMPKVPSEIVILDVKEQRTTDTSKFFHIDFYNISISKYGVIELKFYIFLSKFSILFLNLASIIFQWKIWHLT